ncbi:TPA: hypothetical protein ACN2Q0_002475 [Staphylococcus aureus]|uniref:hypothetical protein n=1 Tax=Staphylococcus aureus TaxID=1280 RepID=UPI00086C4956|nr:hypothetical protein [Staphylococcus aureus]QYC50812.1 hypothetical protein SAP1432_43 [Staphylococcus phage SAP_1432]MCL4616628.1 hypothetical protein [Staphylococcus aureus]MDG6536345.1 hypothetical protein [Staphylococcus aureus]QBY48807.1 hypothetical protein SaO268_1801 [Staphylococcus aureus]SCS66220.1 Uncharacterised protein [Staphylococcus aureus]
MSNLEPIPHKKLLNKRYPNGNIPVNFLNNTENQKDDIMELNENDDSGGGYMNTKYITKEVFEQFEKRIDNKLDSLPDRMADKMDAKISGLEARQTKWFVGIAISTAIGGLSLIVGAVGLIVNLFI